MLSSTSNWVKLTLEVALSAQVADRQPQYGQPVQLAKDVLLEGQQRGQGVQLRVEPLPVSLARVALRDAILRRGFDAGTSYSYFRTSHRSFITPYLDGRLMLGQVCHFGRSHQ